MGEIQLHIISHSTDIVGYILNIYKIIFWQIFLLKGILTEEKGKIVACVYWLPLQGGQMLVVPVVYRL